MVGEAWPRRRGGGAGRGVRGGGAAALWSPGPAAASRAAGVTAARPPRAARSGRWSFVCDGPGPAGLRGSPAPSLLAARRGRPRRRRRPLGRRTARGLLGREAGESRELRPPGRPSPRGQAFGPGVRVGVRRDAAL